MRHHAHGRLGRQVDTLRREFLQGGELPFADVLSAGCLAEALAEIKRPWKDCIFTPLVTLWVFLGQVLNADQSCRAAVARLIAHRVSQGLGPCSSETGAYCQARKRLPERFFSAVARLVGRDLVKEVTCAAPYGWEESVWRLEGGYAAPPPARSGRCSFVEGEARLLHDRRPLRALAGQVCAILCRRE